MVKEAFRNWNPKQAIKIKYMVDKTHYSYWETTVDELFTHITRIADAYMRKRIALTNRQLYYRLVGKDLIPNYIEIYKRICVFLTDLRYGGNLDWEAIEDRGRVPSRKSQWDNIQDLIDSATSQYRLPRWEDQDYYVELYCEKQAMESVLKPIADKYHIYFGYNKGYSSSATMYDVAKRIYEQIEDGKTIVLLYLGDHDPSGLDMIRDVEERTKEFLYTWRCREYGDYDDQNSLVKQILYIDENFFVEQVALTKEQIEQYNPPPNPAKITDPRAKAYIEEHGRISWELDSLEPEVLMQITEDAILEYIDMDKYNAWIEKENEEKQTLIDFGESLKDGDSDAS